MLTLSPPAIWTKDAGMSITMATNFCKRPNEVGGNARVVHGCGRGGRGSGNEEFVELAGAVRCLSFCRLFGLVGLGVSTKGP